MAIDKQTLFLIAEKVRAKVREKREDESRTWRDLGADTDEELLNYWLLGVQGKMPLEYAAIVTAAKKEQDKEYQEYLRLKQKFEQ